MYPIHQLLPPPTHTHTPPNHIYLDFSLFCFQNALKHGLLSNKQGFKRHEKKKGKTELRWITVTACLSDSVRSVWLQDRLHKLHGAQLLFLALREVGDKVSFQPDFWANEPLNTEFSFKHTFHFLRDSCSPGFANHANIKGLNVKMRKETLACCRRAGTKQRLTTLPVEGSWRSSNDRPQTQRRPGREGGTLPE